MGTWVLSSTHMYIHHFLESYNFLNSWNKDISSFILPFTYLYYFEGVPAECCYYPLYSYKWGYSSKIALLFLYRNTFSSQVMEKITDQEWEGAIRWSLMFRQVSHTSSVPAEFESMGRAPQSMPESLVCISNALWEWTHFSFHLWDRLNVTC